MTMYLREIIRSVAAQFVFEGFEDYRQAVDVALGATPVAVDDEWLLDMIDQLPSLEHFHPDVAKDPTPTDNQAWVEFVSNSHMMPFDGRMSTSHILYGSAIQRHTVERMSVYDMVAFFSPVQGLQTKSEFIIGHVAQVYASPMVIRAFEPNPGQGLLFAYKPIGRQQHRQTRLSLFRRDVTIHKMALKFLHDRLMFDDTPARRALDQLPSWLKKTRA